MVKVQDDILHRIDSNRVVVLFLLHLSAAFDSVSHEILLNRLTQRYGITGSVQKWFASYLLSRTEFVQIECSRSSLRELNCGVSSWASVIYFVFLASGCFQSSISANFWWGCAARFSKSWPYFRPKNAIFQTRFQARGPKSILVIKPGIGRN